jgi:DNA-binding MltR family transcriptional regulator
VEGSALQGATALQQEFSGASDRAAAIVAAAFLDDILKDALEAFLVPATSTSEDKKLFGGQGPLATFSSKIVLAHRLGLISDWERQAVDAIRLVRNEFAHVTSDISFRTQTVRDRVKQIETPVELITPEDLLVPESPEDPPPLVSLKKADSDDARAVFQETVLSLLTMLAGRAAHAASEPRQSPPDYKFAHEAPQVLLDTFDRALEDRHRLVAQLDVSVGKLEALIADSTDENVLRESEELLLEARSQRAELEETLRPDSSISNARRVAIYAVEGIKNAHAHRLGIDDKKAS